MSSTKVYASFSAENVLFSKQFAVKRERETLANYVRRMREAKGLSLNEVRVRSGYQIANSYISRIENGEVTNVGLEKLRHLAKGLDVPEEEIFAVARGKSSVGDLQLEELRLINYFRSLPTNTQLEILAFAEFVYQRHKAQSAESQHNFSQKLSVPLIEGATPEQQGIRNSSRKVKKDSA